MFTTSRLNYKHLVFGWATAMKVSVVVFLNGYSAVIAQPSLEYHLPYIDTRTAFTLWYNFKLNHSVDSSYR